MASFGETLRRERELRGISLEEISANTKIVVRLLEALESDDFASLPGGIFTRGFIRAYASYLGLDEEHVLAEYQAIVQPKDYELDRLRSANRAAPTQARKPPVLPLLVAAALLVGGYALFRYSHRAADLSSSLPAAISASPPAATSTPAAPAPVSAPPPEANAGNAAPPVAHPDLKKHRARTTAANGGNAAAQANAGNSTPPTATSAAPPTAPTSTPDEAPAPTAQPSTGATNATASQPASAPAGAAVAVPPPGQGLVLQIAATEPVWVSVDADGKTSLQRVLRAHETAKLKAQDAFDVTTGDAQSLVLTLNGETLKPLGGKGEVKKVHLTREDVKAPSP